MFYVTATAKDEAKAREKLTRHMMSPTLPLAHHSKSPPDIGLDQFTFQVDDDDLLRILKDDIREQVRDVLPRSSLQQDARIVDLDA